METLLGIDGPDRDQENGKVEVSPETLAQLKGGANWFYWIAALSLINSAIFAFGGEVNFVAGLGVTQIVDAVADAASVQSGSSIFRVVAVVIDLFIVALFALAGYYANRAINAVFIAGMAVYLLYGIVFLLLGSVFACLFHVFALIMIFRGYLASREVHRVRTHNAQVG